MDGEYKSISVSGRGHVWAVDLTDRVWWRKGAKTESPTGSGWKCIAGSLSKVSVGPAGVWGLDSKNQVLFRDGTQEDLDDTDGSGWTALDGKFIGLAVGEGIVWGLGANRDFFYRSVLLLSGDMVREFLLALQDRDRQEHWHSLAEAGAAQGGQDCVQAGGGGGWDPGGHGQGQ